MASESVRRNVVTNPSSSTMVGSSEITNESLKSTENRSEKRWSALSVNSWLWSAELSSRLSYQRMEYTYPTPTKLCSIGKLRATAGRSSKPKLSSSKLL